jgi:hypothetical protein
MTLSIGTLVRQGLTSYSSSHLYRNRAAPGTKEASIPSRKNSVVAGPSSKPPAKKVAKGSSSMVDHFTSASAPTKKARRTSDAEGFNAFGGLAHFEPASAN